MKKWIKRVSTGITSLCMLLTLLPSAPAAASNFVEQEPEKEVRASDEIYESGGEVTATESQSLPRAMAEPPDQLLTLDGLIYDLYEEEAWVVGSTSVVSGALTIPDEILEITVTTIGDRAFYDQDKLTEVYIGDNVTSVGVRAFANCDNLQTVRLGEGITELPTSLFEKCKNLSNITIGSRVRRVGYRAFYYCTSLTTFTFPETMTSVETESFYYCSGLKEIRFEGYPRVLSQWIFYNVTTTVFYPKGSDGGLPGTNIPAS